MSGTTNLINISTIINVDSISVQLIPQKKGKMLQIKLIMLKTGFIKDDI